MNNKLDFYDKEISELDLLSIHPFTGNILADQAGIAGKKSTFNVIAKFTSDIYFDVVLWNKKHTFTTEIDFIFVVNGFLILVEAKEWFGVLKNHEDANKIYILYKNIIGKKFTQIRSNPIASVGGFTTDLLQYLKPNAPSKDAQTKRYVVYARDELDFSQVTTTSTVVSCTLKEFEEELQKLSIIKNENPYELQKELPSWDLYFDCYDNKWYQNTVVGPSIETSLGTIMLSDIDMIAFDDDFIDRAQIRLNDGNTLDVFVDRKTIRFNSKMKYAINKVKCIKVNKRLHQEITNG